MENKSYSTIVQVIEFIERNIKTQIDLDEIVAHVNISKYHLHRIFKALTGHSLISYVRGRKISLSLNELLHTNYSVIDIAYEYGFEYEQSYIRAFKSYYHMTPNFVRKYKPTLEILQRLDIQSLSLVKKGFIYKPTFIIKPQFYLVGIESNIFHLDNQENSTANKQAVEFFHQYACQIEHVVNSNVYYGYVRYSHTPELHNYYMPSVEVSQPFNANSPLRMITIPTSEYAVFKYVGFHSPEALTILELNEIYDSSENQLICNTVYLQSNGYHFERIDNEICSYNYCEANIYIPIVNKHIYS